jgi:hypothetical protein
LKADPPVSTRLSLKTLSIAFFVVAFFVLVDVSISSLVDIYSDFSTSPIGILTFGATTLALFCGTYVILKIAENKVSGKNKNERYDKRIARAVLAIYYLMVLINAFIILQLLFFSGYYTGLLSVASSASYGLASFIMGLLAYHFFSWFSRNRSLVVLLYGLASASLSAYVGLVAIIFYVEIFIHQPVTTTLQSAGVFPGIESVFEEILIVTLPGILTATIFLLFWGGTISILYANIRRIGKTRFWILVTAPMIFFLGTLVSLFPGLQGDIPEDDPNSIIIPLYITNFSQIIAIALFAVAFVSIARAIHHHQISDFMYFTCFGLALLSIGIIATISGAGYPPFGLPTVSLVGPFSFLLFIGLHRSAISTAEDSNLRRSIKVSTQEQLKLLKSIGTAEMERKLEKKIFEITRSNADNLIQQSGIEPSLTMDETREYLYEALEEVKKLKK